MENKKFFLLITFILLLIIVIFEIVLIVQVLRVKKGAPYPPKVTPKPTIEELLKILTPATYTEMTKEEKERLQRILKSLTPTASPMKQRYREKVEEILRVLTPK